MKNLMLVAAAALFLSPAAFAKNKGSAQTQDTEKIVAATVAAGVVVAIAIVDDHGELVAAHRMDGCRPRWMRASLRKAYTAAVMERTTETFHSEIVKRQLQIAYYGDPAFATVPMAPGALAWNVVDTVPLAIVSAAVAVNSTAPDVADCPTGIVPSDPVNEAVNVAAVAALR